MAKSENRSPQQPPQAHTGDEDTFLFTMRGLLRPVSWLGNHTESAIAAMAGVWSRYRIRKSKPHMSWKTREEEGVE
ncbi:hypothetical protein Tco_0303683 [Tanacetum coccineum]